MPIIETITLSIVMVTVFSIFCYTILQVMKEMHEHEYKMRQAYYTQRMFENEQVPDTEKETLTKDKLGYVDSTERHRPP